LQKHFEHTAARALEAAAPRRQALQPQPGAGFGRQDKDRAAALDFWRLLACLAG